MSKIEVLKLVNPNGEVMGAYVTYSDFCKMQYEYEDKINRIREWIKDHLYEDGCIDCDSLETDKLLEILK